MRRSLLKAIGAAALAALVICATAEALETRIGPVAVRASVTVQPRVLPERRNAPITLESKTRIQATRGATLPTLSRLSFSFDKHGSIDTRGLPTCTVARLAGTTPALARKRCRGAIVGKGLGRALVTMPGQAPFTISSPITLFNAPAVHGQPALIAHAYETVPVPQAVLVPFVIERIHNGRYGYRVKIELPPIAGGYGAATLAKATLGRTWKRHGKAHSYLSARCQGLRLQVSGSIRFSDGSFLPGLLVPSCKAD